MAVSLVKQVINQLTSEVKEAIRLYGYYGNDYCLQQLGEQYDVPTGIQQYTTASYQSKEALRVLLRKHPAWDEDLQAVVVDGTKEITPDSRAVQDRLYDFWKRWLPEDKVWVGNNRIYYDLCLMYDICTGVDNASEMLASYLKKYEAVIRIGMKPGKCLRNLCRKLGVWDEQNHEFMSSYCRIADMMSAQKKDIKLVLSIHPASFLTISNPKNDNRGAMLTSCHSLNNWDYEYPSGNTGYGTDPITMVLFTCNEVGSIESMYTRKTSRQLFFYNPGDLVLFQNRMYTSEGGAYGCDESTPYYRNMVQGIISTCEGIANQWSKRRYYDGRDANFKVRAHLNYTGYCDWEVHDFETTVSWHYTYNLEPQSMYIFEPGERGICLDCGYAQDHGALCIDCSNSGPEYICHDCGCAMDEDEVNWIGDNPVCDGCVGGNYSWCSDCDTYVPNEEAQYVESVGRDVCDSCINEYYTNCACCEELFPDNDVRTVMIDGDEQSVCLECLQEHFISVQDCDVHVHEDEVFYCEQCGTAYYDEDNAERCCGKERE